MTEKNSIKTCESFLEGRHEARAWLTPSCTAALELACLLIDLKPGDEVVIPSFSFPSCSNAVILRGAVPVYVDIDPQTLNLSPQAVYEALGPKTKAILPIHYAGVDCDMGALLNIARAHELKVIEDAAQCVGSWKLKGDVGCMSFHGSKNVGCGEGGAIFVSADLAQKCDLLRDCGLARSPSGERTAWEGVGQSCLLGEPAAAVLWEGLQTVDSVNRSRRQVWRTYHRLIRVRRKAMFQGNGHIFWFLTKDREGVIQDLRAREVRACSHYEAAHLTAPGLKHGRFLACPVSEEVAMSLVRLPMDVSLEKAEEIAGLVNDICGEPDGDFWRIETQASGQEAFA